MQANYYIVFVDVVVDGNKFVSSVFFRGERSLMVLRDR